MKGMKRSSIERIFIPRVHLIRPLVRNYGSRGRRSIDNIVVRRTRANQKLTRQNSRENGAFFEKELRVEPMLLSLSPALHHDRSLQPKLAFVK